MRRFGLLTTAALTLGSLALPTFARADRGHDDHRGDDRGRVEHRDVVRNEHRDVVVDRRPEVIHRDRVIVRDERPTIVVRPAPTVIVNDDCDYGVALGDVPGCVMDTLAHHGFAGQVEAVQFVRRDGQTFYRFRIDDGRHADLDVRIALDGDLLGIAPAA
jgi:hypothetical protein